MLERLQGIKEISDIREMEVEGFEEYYEFWFEQPVDHEDALRGTFRQRVLLGHRDFNAPVVVELEGYGVHSEQAGELTRLFETNQVVIEHRFFNHSRPEGPTPWECLTIRNAATDQHRIIQALREKVYPGTRWVSTGISKGGQTVVFHRYFYPGDVEVSVPYVAPINLDYIDPRLEKFLLSFRPLACLRGATLAFAVDVHHHPQGILRNGTQAVAQAAVFQTLRQADDAPGEGFERFFFAAPAAGCENGEEKEEEKKKEDAFHFAAEEYRGVREKKVLQELFFLAGKLRGIFGRKGRRAGIISPPKSGGIFGKSRGGGKTKTRAHESEHGFFRMIG